MTSGKETWPGFQSVLLRFCKTEGQFITKSSVPNVPFARLLVRNTLGSRALESTLGVPSKSDHEKDYLRCPSGLD